MFAEPVRSDNFVLTDASGRTTAQMTTSGEGTPAFFMYDTKGTVRISIGLYGDGAPGVVLNDEKGLAAAILRLVQNDGKPVLVLKEDGQDRYILRDTGVDMAGSGAKNSGMKDTIISIIASSCISIITTLAIVSRKQEVSAGTPALPVTPMV